MEDTWGHNELGSSKAKEAVAEPGEGTRIPLPTVSRTDPNGQGNSKSQPRGEGRGATQEVLACRDLPAGFADGHKDGGGGWCAWCCLDVSCPH